MLKVYECGSRLNGEPVEELDCFKYLRSQVAGDGGRYSDVTYNE